MDAKRADAARIEFASLLEGLSRDLPEELRPVALRLLHTIRRDLIPERQDLAILLAHVLRSRKAEDRPRKANIVRGGAPEERKPRQVAAPPEERKPRQVVAPPEDRKPHQVDRLRRPPSPPDEGPVRSAFHERIQEAGETELDRKARRRLGIGPKQR